MLIPTSSAYHWISFQPWACELGWLAQLLGSVPSIGPGASKARAAGIGPKSERLLLRPTWLDF